MNQRQRLDTARVHGRNVTEALRRGFDQMARDEAKKAAHVAIRFLAIRDRGIRKMYGHSIPFAEAK